MDAGRFREGDRVLVLDEVRDGNPRTPRYLRGWTGVVVRGHGIVDNPLDHHEPYPPLYSVLFTIPGAVGEQVLADLHEEWLAPAG
jgi:hypothetical protein